MTGQLNTRQKLFRGVICGLTVGILTLAFWGIGWLDTWEAKSWDWRVSLLANPEAANDDIRLILLDQDSLDWVEEVNGIPWPWPREIFGVIIDYCRRSGVKALAFDVLFTEFSYKGVGDDETLGAALAEFPNFAGAIFLGEETGDKDQWPPEFPAPAFTINGLEQWLKGIDSDKGITFSKASMPIPQIVQNTDILCNVHIKPDPDGIYRQFRLFNLFDDKIFPTLGLGLYLTAHRDIQMSIERGKFTVGNTSIPIDQDGKAVLRYRGPTGTHTNYKAAKVLQAEIRMLNGEDPTDSDTIIFNDLKDKYVFFGFSAPGLKDLRPAPVGGDYPGVEINATVLDNLLSGDFITKIPRWLNVIYMLFLVVIYGILASYFSDPLKNLLIGVVFLALPVLLSLGLYLRGFWLPLVAQETAVISTVILSLVVNYAFEGRQKRFIKDAFKHYLSPKVIEQLIEHPEQLNLGGERRTLSIFFSDIQGFTTISERLKPEDLTALLNDYLSAMTDLIQEEHGTVDKYEGDAIIAFWNAPVNVPDHAVRVVRTALRCQHKLAELRPVFHERMGKDMFMRIGVNTGPAVVGKMGSHTRFDYTMLGDAVNLAARLEGVNKQFGTYTMISQSTLDLLENAFAVRELARVAVVGRKEPVTVYEPMFHEEYEAKKEVLETFVRGLYQFYDGYFPEALDIFSSIQDRDPPAEAYVKKCQELIASPPESWQGVLVMTSK